MDTSYSVCRCVQVFICQFPMCWYRTLLLLNIFMAMHYYSINNKLNSTIFMCMQQHSNQPVHLPSLILSESLETT